MEEKVKVTLSDHLTKLQSIKKAITQVFNDDESRFRLLTTIKICSIPLITILIMIGLLLVILRLDLLFFEAHGLTNIDSLAETFYDYILKNVLETLPYMGLFFVVLIFIGVYIANLFLRPFRLISEYCEKAIKDGSASYDPDFFTDLKLLTRFSEYFFNYMENGVKEGVIKKTTVPTKYTKIHSPVFEKDFFIQFSFLIVLTSIVVGVSLNLAAVEIHDGLISLAHEILKPTTVVKHFLEQQTRLLQDVLLFVTTLHVFLYLFLAIHLYGKISAPAFGIFATMRSFIKGNHSSRVHLIGNYFLRPHCRVINKYLDYLQKNYVVND
ncbi:MAG: hypothetical protein EP326_00985 [Deltaproteobacteria bacterium]|nr:MAG: hypothetical protein EP326_00985 [Deltaproteobacteria bacterium]TNF24631.1 MAG: hypothetical protein EP319_17985 [Deltaproteobacteria bacterium]